jgi:hypothetical protein
MTSDEQLRINIKEVVWREVGDELIVLHMSTATYLTINGSGRMLWKRLSDGASRADLVTVLMDEYEIDDGQASTDVDEFVSSMRACDLLI